MAFPSAPAPSCLSKFAYPTPGCRSHRYVSGLDKLSTVYTPWRHRESVHSVRINMREFGDLAILPSARACIALLKQAIVGVVLFPPCYYRVGHNTPGDIAPSCNRYASVLSMPL